MTSRRGAFIVIEGLDRSGKSTQTVKLEERLRQQGVNVKLYKFPGSPRCLHLCLAFEKHSNKRNLLDRTTATGKMIDSYLRSQSDLDDRAIHLLFAANRWEASERLVKELESGTTIIADRYAFSGIAFSVAKSLPSPGQPSGLVSAEYLISTPTETSTSNSASTLTYEWCRAPEIGLPSPDLVLFLSVEPEIQAIRSGFGEERYEKADLQKRVRTVFQQIANDFNGPAVPADSRGLNWTDIDAGQTIEEVESRIWTAVDPYAKGVNDPVKRLWEKLS